MSSVWIVDDDESIRWVLDRALTRQEFSVRAFATARDCLDAFASDQPDVLVSDIRMPGESGIDLLKRIKARIPKLPVIIMTAFSDLDSAVAALQGGAFEYLPKPFDVNEAIALIRRAVIEGRPSEQVVEVASSDQPEILGSAPAMQEVFRAIGRLSSSNVTVLITGESGTGKELVARALHDHSTRSKRVFVALNTAAIPRDLLESELFGHERGAFTGAQQARVGRFEQAEGGTLFLDEIGDMPAELQTRLLRVLSDGQYYRVGGHQPQRANVRVIAATHQDLEERVRQGLFREDLFHRLHVIRLRLPALRERTDDIPMLSRHFMQKSARQVGGETKRLSEDALALMATYSWPGNVRQLENVCHWLTVMAPSQAIGVGDLPPEIREATDSRLLAATRLTAPATAAGANVVTANFAATLSSQSPADAAVAHTAAASRGVASGSALGNGAGGSVYSGADGYVSAATAAAAAGRSGYDGDRTARSSWPEPSGTVVGVLDRNTSAMAPPGLTVPGFPTQADRDRWSALLAREVATLLDAQSPEQRSNGDSDLMNSLAREFEGTIIKTALQHTRGRRIDAALRLGIGRNTITRKIQELRLDD